MTPTEELIKEHEAILAMLGVLRRVCERLESGSEVETAHLGQVVEFLQGFADRTHHGKEEALLFPAMEAAGIPREGGPIGIMLHEHEVGRGLVRKMAAAGEEVQSGSQGAAKAYSENARQSIAFRAQHIDKENHVLFPMADQVVPARKMKALVTGFTQVNTEKIGLDAIAGYHQLLRELQGTYGE